MFEEAQLVLTCEREGRTAPSPSTCTDDHPVRTIPSTGPAQRDRPAALPGTRAGRAAVDYTRRRARRCGAPSASISRRCTRATRCGEYPRGRALAVGPAGATTSPASTRSPRGPAEDRLEARPGRGPRRPARVLRRPRRRRSLDSVPPPRGRAALHARAGHHSRGHRPRAPARDADVRRAAPPRGRRHPAPHRRVENLGSSRTCSGSRSSSGSSSRMARCAPTAPVLSSYGETRSSATWSIRPLDLAEMGTADYDITHYQPVLYRAESVDEVGGRRRLLRHLHRRVDRGSSSGPRARVARRSSA